jgi:hypothetical protein
MKVKKIDSILQFERILSSSFGRITFSGLCFTLCTIILTLSQQFYNKEIYCLCISMFVTVFFYFGLSIGLITGRKIERKYIEEYINISEVKGDEIDDKSCTCESCVKSKQNISRREHGSNYLAQHRSQRTHHHHSVSYEEEVYEGNNSSQSSVNRRNINHSEQSFFDSPMVKSLASTGVSVLNNLMKTNDSPPVSNNPIQMGFSLLNTVIESNSPTKNNILNFVNEIFKNKEEQSKQTSVPSVPSVSNVSNVSKETSSVSNASHQTTPPTSSNISKETPPTSPIIVGVNVPISFNTEEHANRLKCSCRLCQIFKSMLFVPCLKNHELILEGKIIPISSRLECDCNNCKKLQLSEKRKCINDPSRMKSIQNLQKSVSSENNDGIRISVDEDEISDVNLPPVPPSTKLPTIPPSPTITPTVSTTVPSAPTPSVGQVISTLKTAYDLLSNVADQVNTSNPETSDELKKLVEKFF